MDASENDTALADLARRQRAHDAFIQAYPSLSEILATLVAAGEVRATIMGRLAVLAMPSVYRALIEAELDYLLASRAAAFESVGLLAPESLELSDGR